MSIPKRLGGLAVAALFGLLSSAASASVTVTPGSVSGPLLGLNGTSTLTFSGDMLSFGDLTSLNVTSASPGAVQSGYDNDGLYVKLAMSAPLASLTLNTDSKTVEAWSGNGGANMGVPSWSAVSHGGSLSLGNLTVDLVDKKIYADLFGANGVGGQSHVNLWTFGQYSDQFDLIGQTGGQDVMRYTQSIQTLSLTGTGMNIFSQSLGLDTVGMNSLQSSSTDFGSLQTTAQFKTAQGYMGNAAPVPEPASYALMGLGLLALAWVARKRPHQ